MSPDYPPARWCHQYDLVAQRRHRPEHEPAPHQNEALDRLRVWHEQKGADPRGGVLVLPTGGGKTFTATHFLCRHPLTEGYKVLWLAHTHHLLEQAANTFAGLVGLILPPRDRLTLRVVSGTPGHLPVHTVKATDDVVVGTLQTVANAARTGHPALDAFLDSAGDRLFVVFDEAHHSPAPSYRRLLVGLRERTPRMRLLGLTATPTHTDQRQRGWFRQLFPQGVVHEVTAAALMASGVLARPVFEETPTEFTPAFDDAQYREWVRTNRDLPEEIVTLLADNQSRNERIANHYAGNAERYGKTIIFADRWPQCVAIREMLRSRGIPAGAVYHHRGGAPGTAEARNRQTEDENRAVLRAFRDNELRVLVNIRMLTEGTDIPDAQTVFLTRQTTSQILLTQMVGRALRGPAFGGTERAYVVSFIDDWRQRINWAGFGPFLDGLADDRVPASTRRPPVQLISVELVRRLARQMDSGVNINPAPYSQFLPVGWYHVRYDVLVAGTDDEEQLDQLVMVFEGEVEGFDRLIARLRRQDLGRFEGAGVTLDDVREAVEGWDGEFFPGNDLRVGDRLVDILAVARHMAQDDQGQTPRFFRFEARGQHDLDAVAQRHLDARLDRWEEDDALQAEYRRPDRFWPVLYQSYDRFQSHYEGCARRLVHARRHGATPASHRPAARLPEAVPPREPEGDLRQAAFQRDGRRCLCCGFVGPLRSLVLDHVVSYHVGGPTRLENLQTLCRACNESKGTESISFRTSETTLTQAPGMLRVDLPRGVDPRDLEDCGQYVRRVVNLFYRCAAVTDVDLAARGERFRRWTVTLVPGLDPGWLAPHLPALVAHLRRCRESAGLQPAPDEIELVGTGG